MKHRHPYHLITHVTILLFHLFLFLSPLTAQSLRFHPVFSDDMVLQREKPVAIFGFGKPGSEVSVEFKGLNQKTIIEPEGRWKVVLPEFSTSTEGALLKATSENESISCKNLLVGDVWFCGGQSNMHHTFNMYTMLKGNIPSLGNPLVRFYPVNHQISDKPLLEPVSPTVAGEPLSNRWYPSNPSTLGNCSPTAYFFAAKVSEELKVPVGVIVSSWGATQAEVWTPKEVLDPLGLKIEIPFNPKASIPHEIGVAYNSMIHPFFNLTFKGFVWYQGESNGKYPENYKKIFPAMIGAWRDGFNAPENPFYFVQIAPFNADSKKGLQGEDWAWIREAQKSALALPKTGMAVTTDLGEYEDIHPQNKKEIGERIALFALRDAGLIEAESPAYDSMEIKENRILIRFKNASSGLESRRVVMNNKKDQPIKSDPEAFVVEADQIRGFVICGEDQKFVDAQVEIVGDHIEVWSEKIARPIAVRYAWKSFPLCNLYSKAGLPVAPFRTDTFPMPPLF